MHLGSRQDMHSVSIRIRIKSSKTRVEKYCEERLFDKDGATGERYSLQVNFGWRDEHAEEQQTGPVVTIINDIPQTGLQEEQTETVSFSPLRKTDAG